MIKQIPFQELDKEIQSRFCVIPQCVSVTKNPDDETDEQIELRQNKFLALPEYVKIKLLSDKTGGLVRAIGENYHLELLQLADISRAIRSYYFGELALENFPAVLSGEMGINLNTAKEISQAVIQKIINDDSAEKAYQARMEHISLLEALKKYPEIEEQTITQDSIKIRNHQDPVRPSIENWLSDYTARLGYTSHDSIERGNYLFQSENTRNLSYGDRQKLSQILRSFDEKTPLTVDVDAKQIIFSESVPNKKPEASSIYNPPGYSIHNQISDDQPASPAGGYPVLNKIPTSDIQPDLRPADEKQMPKLPQAPEVKFSHDIVSENAYHSKTQEPGKGFEKVIGLPEKEEKTPTGNTRIVNLKEQVEKNPPPIPPKPKNLLNIKELIQQSQEERVTQETKSSPVQKNPQAGIQNPQISQRPVSPFSKPNPAKWDQFSDESAHVLDFSGKTESVEHKEPVQKEFHASLSRNTSLHPQNYFQKELDTPGFRESLDNAEKKLFQKNNSDSNIQFSSPQKLPYEKEREELQEKPIIQTQPSSPPKPSFPPYRI